MGVDIYCNDIHTRFTYIGFQGFRLMLLKATLKYIENSKKELKTIYEKTIIMVLKLNIMKMITTRLWNICVI